jgi:hypothetical protein
MAQTGTVSRSGQGIARGSNGTNTGDGTVLTVNLGFRPKMVTIFNETDAILWQKMDTQADANAMKQVTAGTTTKDTTSAIVFSANGFSTSAALNASGKVLHWVAV